MSISGLQRVYLHQEEQLLGQPGGSLVDYVWYLKGMYFEKKVIQIYLCSRVFLISTFSDLDFVISCGSLRTLTDRISNKNDFFSQP